MCIDPVRTHNRCQANIKNVTGKGWNNVFIRPGTDLTEGTTNSVCGFLIHRRNNLYISIPVSHSGDSPVFLVVKLNVLEPSWSREDP